eukprot:scaffold30968_cov66-Phaeocystis_antarctica.AAC.1
MHMCDVHVHVHVHVHVAWRGALWRAPGAGSRVRVWGDVRARDTYEIRDSLKDGGGPTTAAAAAATPTTKGRLYVVALSRPRELSPGGDRLGPRTAHEVRAVELELRAWWGVAEAKGL